MSNITAYKLSYDVSELKLNKLEYLNCANSNLISNLFYMPNLIYLNCRNCKNLERSSIERLDKLQFLDIIGTNLYKSLNPEFLKKIKVVKYN